MLLTRILGQRECSCCDPTEHIFVGRSAIRSSKKCACVCVYFARTKACKGYKEYNLVVSTFMCIVILQINISFVA